MQSLKKLIPHSIINAYWHYPQAMLANYYYGFPAKKLKIVGVAGTKGKSTTCHLIARILEEAGYHVAMLSTTTIKCGSEQRLNHLKMTSPDVWFLQKFLAYCVTQKIDYVVLEVSSHALKQYRTYGIPFHTVLITNLTPDHQEYHPTPFDYQATHKLLITPSLKTLVLNGDDPDTGTLTPTLSPPGRGGEQVLVFHHGNALAKFLEQEKLPFLAGFNIYNGLAAATVAESLGVSRDNIKTALQNPGTIPGRLEEINEGQPFKIIVDYAHSPVSLKALFEVITPPSPPLTKGGTKRGSTIVVFGACGERDPKARPLMGSVLDHGADTIIVTNDDPYGENPEKIASDLIAGIKHKISEISLLKILDRRTAIAKALALAQPGDLVLILGKGAEQLQVIGNKKIPWDDRVVVRNLLQSQLDSSKAQKLVSKKLNAEGANELTS